MGRSVRYFVDVDLIKGKGEELCKGGEQKPWKLVDACLFFLLVIEFFLLCT